MKYSKQEYEFVCSLIWGTSPLDRTWAEESSMFKANAPKLLQQYPKLDASFKEEMDKLWDHGLPNTFQVLDTWSNNRSVYKGTRKDCEKYVAGSNVYQSNYSKLRINRIRGDTS